MRSKILKLLAVISFGLITFPFVLTNDVLAFEDISVLRILCYYGVFGVIFGLGMAFGKITLRHKKFIFLERFMGVLTFATGLLMLFFTDHINIIVAVGASAVLWYFLGGRASRKHYADIFPAFMFGVYIIVTIICYLFFGAMCEKEVREPVLSAVIIAFMVELCLAALLINQSNIYDKANRRRETRTALPKGLSGYNAGLVLGITLIGLFLYLFSDGIVWLLNGIVKLIIRAALFIMYGYTDFMATEAVDSSLQSGNGYMQFKSHALWDLVLAVVITALIIIFRKQIFTAIKNFLKRIYGFFVKQTELSEPEPEFVDVFEEIGSSRTRNGGYVTYTGLMKLYKKEADPVKKYRHGYNILLKQLQMCKADIRGADTVTDQHDKGRALCGAELKTVTDSYDKLRYNDDTVTAEQLAALDTLINQLNSLIKRRI